jgi:hypothetical protein
MGSKTKLTSAAGIPLDDKSEQAGPRGTGLPSARHLFIVPTMNPNPAPEGSRSTFTDQVNQHS